MKEKRSARMRTRRRGRWLLKQPRLGARMCQGTFFFTVNRNIKKFVIFFKKSLHSSILCDNIFLLTAHGFQKLQSINAGMAELADAYGSGPYDSNIMRVQVSFPAR